MSLAVRGGHTVSAVMKSRLSFAWKLSLRIFVYIRAMKQSAIPIPADEDYRLAVLHDLDLLDTQSEPEFDRVAFLAGNHFDTKFALFSLVDKGRQWFKASCGLDAEQTDREHAFCAHAIMKRDVFVVLDATLDKRFARNPLVVGEPHIRFYAGVPIIVKNAAIGTLCIIDDKPRSSFDEDEKNILKSYAKIIEDEIRLREQSRENVEKFVEGYQDARALAEAGEAAKAQFMAMMGHELRTPLNAIIGFAQCITDELLGPVTPLEYKQFADDIAASGTRQLTLVNRLLALTDQGFIDVEEDVIDLHQMITQCMETLSGEILIASVTAETRLPDHPIYLKADPVHIEQTFMEVIGNAIKFTPKNGRVLVELGCDSSDCVFVKVTDTGSGIEENALQNAIAAFGQIDNGLNRKHEGAGIGLPIVNKLVELHGGDFSLTNARDGGTLAQVRFPSYRTVSAPPNLTMAG